MKADLTERVKGLCAGGADMILVKEPYLAQKLTGLKFDGIDRKVYIVVVEDFDDIKTMSEQTMLEAGWVRISRAAEMVAEAKAELEKDKPKIHLL